MYRSFMVAMVAVVMLALAGVASAAVIATGSDLSGLAEFPPNASPGTGHAEVTLDTSAHTLHVVATFAGLLAGTTAAHIHGPVDPLASPPTAGVITQLPFFDGFPLGVTSGTYDHTFDTLDSGTWNASFITANGGTAAGAEAAFATALDAGHTYLNIHTSSFAGGEIRGFLAVPEPSVIGLLLVGMPILLRRRRAC